MNGASQSAHPGGGDPFGQGPHAGGELVVGQPVPHGPLPAVVDLDDVEPQTGEAGDVLVQHLFGDALVVGVPRAPHVAGAPVAAAQPRGQLLGVVCEDLLLRAVGEEPGGSVFLAPADEGVLVGGQAGGAQPEGAQQQHPAVGALQRGHGRGVVPGRIVPDGVVGGQAPFGLGDPQRGLAEAAPSARAPGVLTVAVEQGVAETVQDRDPAWWQHQTACHGLGGLGTGEFDRDVTAGQVDEQGHGSPSGSGDRTAGCSAWLPPHGTEGRATAAISNNDAG
jgi:hypothetical protein